MATISSDEVLQRVEHARRTATLYWLGAGGAKSGGTLPGHPAEMLDVVGELLHPQPGNEAKAQRYREGAAAAGIDILQLPRPAPACDCSGFVTWALGIPRHPAPELGGWLDTSAIYRDALQGRRLFEPVALPLPGTLLVYPDRGAGRDREEGHVAIVIETRQGRATRIVHCESRNFALAPEPGYPRNAICATGTECFDARADTLCVQLRGMGR